MARSPWIAARATLALKSGEWLRRFLLVASLRRVSLITEESTYLSPITAQSMGSTSLAVHAAAAAAILGEKREPEAKHSGSNRKHYKAVAVHKDSQDTYQPEGQAR